MPTIKVSQKDETKTLFTGEETTLLKLLQDNGFAIYSPCGRNGTCGKCRVFVKGEGAVTSCIYPVTSNIEVVLPEKREAQILVDQHNYTTQVPHFPGKAVDLSYYPHGVAIDIGTSTIVFYLANLLIGSTIETTAIVNPQVKYGADVISRINFTAQNPDGLKLLQHEIRQSINDQLDHFMEVAEISSEEIVKVTLTGNPTMMHLLLGINPLPIALAPFTTAFVDEQKLLGKELQLHCHPEAEIKILPSLSAYIGSDIMAGIASIQPSSAYQRFLFLDIGTNGEMALVTPEKIWCCATAAGPAFEGANISCGLSAVEGAINAYRLGDYSVIGNARPVGVCGSGLIDIIAHLLDKKLLHSDGLLAEDFMIVPGETPVTSIVLNQQDIREVQLAKSAIRAGINALMKKASISFDEIDVLFLAGGFGSYIDVSSAVKIGLLPKEMENKTISLGNTSGTGALLSLKSTTFDDVQKSVIDRSEYIEIAQDHDFVMDFITYMDF